MEKYYRISRDELERIIEMAANSAVSKFSQQIEIAQKAAPVYVPGKGISAKRSKVAHKPRRAMSLAIVSRTRFLEGVRRFLELQGLSLDKRVERLYHCSL